MVAASLYAMRRRSKRTTTPARRRAFLLVTAILGLNLVIGSPAMAQDSCAQAPNPERPGSGMVGALDPPVGKRGSFALGGMWLAASTLVLVNNYGRIDDAIVKTTTGIQAGFVDPDSDRIIRDVLPADLHNKVIYENWLRGEFGKPDAPQATEFGRKLLDAQAWTVDDIRTGKDADNNTENA